LESLSARPPATHLSAAPATAGVQATATAPATWDAAAAAPATGHEAALGWAATGQQTTSG